MQMVPTAALYTGTPYLKERYTALPTYPVQSQDTFEAAAFALIKPTGKESYVIEGRVSPTGQIYQKCLNGIQVLGQIDALGNYRLINNMSGNSFLDKRVLIQGFQEEQSLFAQAMKAGIRQRAINGSEIPLIRKKLTALGINGQGITIGILDPQEKNKITGQWQSSNHTKSVTQVINDPVWGVAPGAQVVDLGEQWEINSEIPSDNNQAFANMVTGDYTRLFTRMKDEIQKALMRRDPSLRVLNATNGNSRSEIYRAVWEKLSAYDENRYYKFPAIRAAVFGPTLYTTQKQQFAAVVRSVNNLLDNSPVVQQAWLSYVETTRQAAQKGLIIVQAAANENNALPFDIP